MIPGLSLSLQLLEKLYINNSPQQAASKEVPGRNIRYFILCQKAKLDFRQGDFLVFVSAESYRDSESSTSRICLY